MKERDLDMFFSKLKLFRFQKRKKIVGFDFCYDFMCKELELSSYLTSSKYQVIRNCK